MHSVLSDKKASCIPPFGISLLWFIPRLRSEYEVGKRSCQEGGQDLGAFLPCQYHGRARWRCSNGVPSARRSPGQRGLHIMYEIVHNVGSQSRRASPRTANP